MFASVNQLASVIESCYATIERQEKKSIAQNRQINELLSSVHELGSSKPSQVMLVMLVMLVMVLVGDVEWCFDEDDIGVNYCC